MGGLDRAYFWTTTFYCPLIWWWRTHCFASHYQPIREWHSFVLLLLYFIAFNIILLLSVLESTLLVSFQLQESMLVVSVYQLWFLGVCIWFHRYNGKSILVKAKKPTEEVKFIRSYPYSILLLNVAMKLFKCNNVRIHRSIQIFVVTLTVFSHNRG